jgi:hypothetical protein
MTVRRSFGRSLVLPALAVAMLLLAACEPMPHTTFTERAAPGAGADLALLSGDGRYVVLTATGAGPVVPGAGNWRVDRTTGDAVALPAGTPDRISADGARVLLTSGGIRTLWDGGTTSSPTGVLSPDLTAQAFVGVSGSGSVQTQDLATGVVRPVETAFPRPPGTTAWVHAVSDDGDTVVYGFESTIRVVDLGAGASFDIASLALDGAEESVLLAGSGAALARTVQEVICMSAGCGLMSSSIDWIEVPTGAILGHYDNTTQEIPRFTRIADNGRAVWSYQEETVGDDWGYPSCPSAPFAATCVVSASLVELSAHGVRVDPLGAGRGIALDASANGRFAALTREQPGYAGLMPDAPVRVVDRLSSGPRWETLTGGPSPSARARISDDGVVISTTSETGGWYDFEA